MSTSIKPKERTAILKSLKAGVAPMIGLEHIQVGRKDEIEAIIKDLELIENDSATIRFIIGRYGSGKSFFLNLSRILALEKGFVVVQADITTERRLQSSSGHAMALYSEMMQNMATRSKPNGRAISSVVQRWVSDYNYRISQSGGGFEELKNAIHQALRPLQDYVSGYDFAQVLIKYTEGFHKADDHLMDSALRWLRAEYQTKTEARQDLGVRSIIDDGDIYDYLKLMGHFVRLADYKGLLVNIDELVVLSHRLNHKISRERNYEMILSILNDCLQGNVSGIGFIFAGTDEFLEDRRRGLYSYEALATRLSQNVYATNGLKDFSGPVINLSILTHEEIFVLLHNIRNVFASGDKDKYLVPNESLKSFQKHWYKTLGSEYFGSVRDIAKSFADFLSIIEQNPGTDWRGILKDIKVEKTPEPDMTPVDDDEELATLKL